MEYVFRSKTGKRRNIFAPSAAEAEKEMGPDWKLLGSRSMAEPRQILEGNPERWAAPSNTEFWKQY